ncbi:MAG: glycosyltransferase family 2 protein [bacterium]|nr:glycosyltransferase family 2 protein [bacterium]
MNISIIIVNFNTIELLKRCLTSIKRYAGITGYEIIVVDNNSNDGSSAMVQHEFPEVRLIASKENLGFVGGNNLAAKSAQGKYLLLLNSDTELTEEGLSGIYEFAEHRHDAGLVGGKMLNADGSVQYSCRKFPTLLSEFINQTFCLIKYFNPFATSHKMMKFDYNSIQAVDWVSGAYMLLKKDLASSIGLFNPHIFMFFEDTDLCKRIRKTGREIYFYPSSTIYHFHGMSSKKNISRSIAACFHGSLIYFCTHHGKRKTHLYKWAVLSMWHLFKYGFSISSKLIHHPKLIKKRELFTQCIVEYKIR